MEGANWRAEFEAKAPARRRFLERNCCVPAVVAAALGVLMVRSALHPDSSLQYQVGVLQAAALEFAVAVAFIVSLVRTRRLRVKVHKDERARVCEKVPIGTDSV